MANATPKTCKITATTDGTRYTMNNAHTEVTLYQWDRIMDLEQREEGWKLTGMGTHRETGEEWRRFSKEVITTSPRAFGNYYTGTRYRRKTQHLYLNTEDTTLGHLRPKMLNQNRRVIFWTRSGHGWGSYKDYLHNRDSAHDEVRRVEVRIDGKEYVNAVIFKSC